jgi:hypothetical protein
VVGNTLRPLYPWKRGENYVTKKKFYENHRTHKIPKERNRHKKIDNWRARRDLNPLNAETDLWDPIFLLEEEEAHTHTHSYTINIDQILILIN